MQNTHCKLQNADCTAEQTRRRSLRCAPRHSRGLTAYRLPPTAHGPPPTAYRAFTLVELLVSIVIVGILASIVLFALASVTESAKADKTRSTISKLNSLVMAKYESYRTRRVPITIPKSVFYDAMGNPIPNAMRTAAGYRLDALREMMRMEMPDRYSDILDDPVTRSVATDNTSPKIQVPAATQGYRAIYASSPGPIMAYESAKCLYLLIAHGVDDPDVMSQFSEDEIATDARDNMRYFVDGWGQPIFFIRWAPGFGSPLQPYNYNSKDVFGNSIATKVYATDHDQFDTMNARGPQDNSDIFWNPDSTKVSQQWQNQFHPPLYPLIYSAGPDRIFDIFVNTNPDFHYSTTDPPNDPYTIKAGGLFGAPTDQDSDFTPANVTVRQGDGVDNSIDNITNHDMSETQ